MEVLEHEQDRAAFAEAGQQAQDRLEHPRLAALWIDRRRTGGQQPERRGAGLDLGHQAQDLLGAGLDQGRQVGIGHPFQEPGEGDADRRVGITRSAGTSSAANHLERLGQAGQTVAGLGQQARDADPTGARDQEGGRAAGCGRLETGRDPGKFTLPPHEARARERRRHHRILGAR